MDGQTFGDGSWREVSLVFSKIIHAFTSVLEQMRETFIRLTKT